MRIIIVIALLLSVPLVEAQANEFNTVGAACYPAETAIANQSYLTTSGTVKQEGAMSSAQTTFYCPITHAISSPSHLYLSYSSTEDDAETYVAASYIKMHKSSGALTTIATSTSRDGDNDGTWSNWEVGFSDTYDPSTYVYYVRVDLDRRNTSQTVVFYNVTVW